MRDNVMLNSSRKVKRDLLTKMSSIRNTDGGLVLVRKSRMREKQGHGEGLIRVVRNGDDTNRLMLRIVCQLSVGEVE